MYFFLVLNYFVSSKYLEYRLSENYGQIIYDSSLNQRHAVNGLNSQKDNADCLYTDRGLFLSHTISHLKFPSKSSELAFISDSYQMIFWINIHQTGRLAYRYTPESFWILYVTDTNRLFISIHTNDLKQFPIFSSSQIDLKKWIFFTVKVSLHRITVLVNENVFIENPFESIFKENGNIMNGLIGTDFYQDASIVGFLWYLAILLEENSSDFIYRGSSNNCLTGKTCECNPAIKINSSIGCVASEIDIQLNSKGENCTYSKCSGGALDECGCSSQSCFFQSYSHCDCLDKAEVSKDTCFCPDGLTCCNPGCSKCKGLDLCTECKDLNAYVSNDSRCYCKKGFFGPKPLDSLGNCIECNQNCEVCTSKEFCLECKLKHQVATNGKCECIEKYFMNQDLKCEICHQDCLICLNLTTCSECLDQNSKPGSIGCDCVQGYWKNISKDSYKCEKCSDLCKSCNESEVCLECENAVAIENRNGKCECIEKFFMNKEFECEACHQDCFNCLDSTTCTKCLDENSEPAIVGCDCALGYFKTISNESNKCEKCPDYCEECSGINNSGQVGKCITCIKNYTISNGFCIIKCGDYEAAFKNVCHCIKGYIRFEKECIPDCFKINVLINRKNKISLSFTEELKQSLSKNSFIIETSISKYSSTLEKLSSSSYVLKFSFFENVENGSSLKIIFKLPLLNKKNQSLNESQYHFTLNEYLFISESKRNIIEQTKKSSKYSNSVSIFLSLLVNPSAAWLLINTLQIIYFLPLSQAPLSPAVDEFCRAVADYSLIPNVPEIILDGHHSETLDEQAKKIGIKSSVIWINMGSELTLLPVLLFLWLIFWIISIFNINWCKMKLNSILSSYKYSVFFRFWIQNHLIIGVYSFIHKNSIQENDAQLSILSSILSTTLISLFIVTPSIIFLILWIDEKIIKESLEKDYSEKYGSLFDEFENEKGLIHFIYYPIFTLRSLTFAISQIYLSNFEYLHRGLNFGFTLIMLLYLLIYRPFKIKSILVSNILSESFNSLIMLLIFMKSFVGFFQSGDYFDFCFIGIILIQILFQYAIGAYLLLKDIASYYKILKKIMIEKSFSRKHNENSDS